MIFRLRAKISRIGIPAGAIRLLGGSRIATPEEHLFQSNHKNSADGGCMVAQSLAPKPPPLSIHKLSFLLP
eukprot:583636-Amphidinium_carterae.1